MAIRGLDDLSHNALAEAVKQISEFRFKLDQTIAFSAVQDPTSWSASTDTGSVGAAALTPSRAVATDCKMCGMTVAEHERRSACDTKWYGTSCNGDLHYWPIVEVEHSIYWYEPDGLYEFDGEKVVASSSPIEQQDDPGDADFTTGPLISRARFRADVDMRGCYGTPAAYTEALRKPWTEEWETLAADILNRAFETGGAAAAENADAPRGKPVLFGIDAGSSPDRTVAYLWDPATSRAVPLDATGHDFGSQYLAERCSRCGATVEAIEDDVAPLLCPQAVRKPPERLTDLEVDGSIGKAMRDIMKQEGRQPPEWLDADKEAKSG